MKLGLVLAGGGARGAYQIEVWKALAKLKIDKYIKVVSGIYIGVLNTILFLQGDIKLAEEIWCNVTSIVLHPNFLIILSAKLNLFHLVVFRK